jgi:hypothetical protein
VARTAEGTTRGQGSNVLDLAADSRIARLVGFWRA